MENYEDPGLPGAAPATALKTLGRDDFSIFQNSPLPASASPASAARPRAAAVRDDTRGDPVLLHPAARRRGGAHVQRPVLRPAVAPVRDGGNLLQQESRRGRLSRRRRASQTRRRPAGRGARGRPEPRRAAPLGAPSPRPSPASRARRRAPRVSSRARVGPSSPPREEEVASELRRALPAPPRPNLLLPFLPRRGHHPLTRTPRRPLRATPSVSRSLAPARARWRAALAREPVPDDARARPRRRARRRGALRRRRRRRFPRDGDEARRSDRIARRRPG